MTTEDTEINEERSNGPVRIILIAVAVFIGVFLFPRRNKMPGAGIVSYESIGTGMIYSVEILHRLPDHADENGCGYYEKGVVIKLFEKEIYRHTYTDYERIAETSETSIPKTMYDD